jgi:hypothetical protein
MKIKRKLEELKKPDSDSKELQAKKKKIQTVDTKSPQMSKEMIEKQIQIFLDNKQLKQLVQFSLNYSDLVKIYT